MAQNNFTSTGQSGGTVVDWIMNNGQFQSGNTITNGAAGYLLAR
jgi:hypothetical protein